MFLVLLVAASLVNFIGVFTPEIGFDALWYHLTIPKLYLDAGKIYHIPGGLLYYSELPRLMEILYIPLIKYLGEVGPHLLSWGAGIGSAVVTYKLARKFLSTFYSLLSAVIFYVTPLVGWQSGSGYVDLQRTFFEVLALYFAIDKKFLLAGLVTGLAISTKTFALGSIPIFALLVYMSSRRFIFTFYFLLSTFLISLPWFLSAYLNTGHPFYPIGAGILDSRHALNPDFWNIPKFAFEFVKLWIIPEDPISPIYLITIPFILPVLKNKKFIWLLVYCVTGLLVWYLTPRTGGGRFILPYLPAFAILAAAVVSRHRILVFAVLFISLVNLSYRFLAVSKTFPYLSGQESKTNYLCRTLDTNVTFVNCQNLKPNGLVLLSGYHNLYYVDFPFVHESWYRGENYSFKIQP